MITHLDSEVGKIWEAVKARGQEENTLILFSSDNGPTFAGGVDPEYFNSAGGFRGLKMDVYEGGIRVPFIAYWKNKIKAGQTSDLVSGHWDMFNTFAELVGQKPSSPDGISLLPELLGKDGQRNHPFLYFEYPEKRGQIALRMGDWKGVKIEWLINRLGGNKNAAYQQPAIQHTTQPDQPDTSGSFVTQDTLDELERLQGQPNFFQ